MKMDKRVTESLARVNGTEPHLLEWLRDRLKRHQDHVVHERDDVAVRWAQGRTQELTDLIKAFEGAANDLRKV